VSRPPPGWILEPRRFRRRRIEVERQAPSPRLLFYLSAVFDDPGDVAGAVEELVRHAAADRAAPPVCRPLVDEQLLDHQVFAVGVEVCSALADADLIALATSRAACFGENSRYARASVTFMPLTESATSLALRGARRTYLWTAETSIVATYFSTSEPSTFRCGCRGRGSAAWARTRRA